MDDEEKKQIVSSIAEQFKTAHADLVIYGVPGSEAQAHAEREAKNFAPIE